MTARDIRPLHLATFVAVLTLGLLWVGAVHGWLGPDVGRGGAFCEAARTGLIKQPANALSNLGFVAAGLVIAWQAGRPGGALERRGLATAYAVLVVVLGPGSMAMHATETNIGGRLDTLSMYLLASFAAAYALMRLTGAGVGAFGAMFAVLVVGCELVERAGLSVPVLMTGGNVAFAVLLLFAALAEARWLRRRGSRGLGWGIGALASMALAFSIWNLAKDGGPLCHPHSLLQGHAAWHLLCALAAYCLYRLYAASATGHAVQTNRGAVLSHQHPAR